MKSVTVPFFISHQGCPHTCVFCDQRTISGTEGFLPDAGQITEKINLWRTTSGERPLEVAFFGGTFTALSEAAQVGLLAPLQPLLEDGTINAVRISTRPEMRPRGGDAEVAAAEPIAAAGGALHEPGKSVQCNFDRRW